MTSYTVETAKHATLTGATIDQVTILNPGGLGFEVVNRGTADIFFTATRSGNEAQPIPPDPTIAGDNTHVVPAKSFKTFFIFGSGYLIIKIIGAGDAYSVEALA